MSVIPRSLFDQYGTLLTPANKSSIMNLIQELETPTDPVTEADIVNEQDPEAIDTVIVTLLR